MSQQLRQAEFFAGEDWTVLYRAFNQVNFNSYDPPSINAALREYIQTNYPEDFNDWTESSELVAIIDLLSWLAGSLAFRTDINARENFLETAQARESVLRLARFLSYNPRRAQSARGMVKITEIKSTQSIQDSFGINLNNRSIKWNDPDNPDWQEQFTLILNAAMPVTNPYGIPFKNAVLGEARTQLYRMNTTYNPQCVYKFTATVDGGKDIFELVNVDFDPSSGFSERAPNPANGFHLLYRNDGKGNSSIRTGFFMFFKQGTLKQELFTITSPIENRLIDIKAPNISETDVWVHTISDENQVVSEWAKVPAIFSENITFNSLAADIRDIFSVVTRDNDTVSLRFGDGRFGTVPVGNLKTWYRTVNGKQYQIRPRDMENIQVAIPYVDNTGREQTLTLRISLQETVSNSVGAETIEQIRQRAPQVYGTQNRMVSGEDYNVFPLSSNEVVKMRAVNRVYSGHSRFLDINDPTSTLQDTKVFSNDGILYREDNATQYSQATIAANLTPEQIISRKIQPMLSHTYLQSYFTHLVPGVPDTKFSLVNGQPVFKWKTLTSNGFSSTGYLERTNYDLSVEQQNNFKKYFGLNCKLLFTWQEGQDTKYAWAQVTNTVITSANFDSQITSKDAIPITVDEGIPTNASIVQIIPPYRSKLDPRQMLDRSDLEVSTEMAKLEEFIALKKPFKLWYSFDATSTLMSANLTINGRWYVQEPSTPAPSQTAVMVMTGSYMGGLFWSFEVPVGVRYVFESLSDVRWHDLKNHKVIDGVTGLDNRDTISVIWPGIGKPETVVWDIVDNVYDPDGLPDYRRVVVTPRDSDDDGFVDIPTSYQDVVDNGQYAIFLKDTQALYQPLIPQPNMPQVEQYTTQQMGDWIYVTVGNEINPKGFYSWDGNAYVFQRDSDYVAVSGRANLRFEWKHFSGTDTRIDPAVTNIIDCFVLTSEYDFATRQWIKNGTPSDGVPTPPSDLDLQIMFKEFEQYKMFSDQIIWRPVKYKYLFGDQAQDELKAQFKIVRLPNSQLSDGEIRSRVIQAINNYFDVNKWEFGETFYFTELAAYIHMQLATAISSVVIVPLANTGKFGELFEVRCESNEMFVSTAQVSDVVIIDGNTMANLRIS